MGTPLDYPFLWAVVAAEFAVHMLPDGSQYLDPVDVAAPSEADSWAELAHGTLE